MARKFLVVLFAFVLNGLLTSHAHAQSFRLKDGRVLTGRVLLTSGVTEKFDPTQVEPDKTLARPILLVDDELRRIFVSRTSVAETLDAAPETQVTIRPWQQPSQGARALGSVGPCLGLTPFDEFGRRIYDMQTADGLLSVVQGITELTPRYAKVEALSGPAQAVSWDSRIATSSIPRDTLAKILARAVRQDDWQQRLQVVRFYNQAKRFQEARQELERILEEFPDQKDLQNEVVLLRQYSAKALLEEIDLRRRAGQHRLSTSLLENFPVDEVSGDTLVQVREMTAAYEQQDARIQKIAATLRAIAGKIENPDNRGLAAPVAEEITRELSHNTIDRLVPFVQFVDDPSLSAEDKTALAVSGWLTGGDHAAKGLGPALALVKARDVVLQYLREGEALSRKQLIDSLYTAEGVTVERLAQIIARMKPPGDEPLQRSSAPPKNAPQPSPSDSALELTAPGRTDDGDFRYLVQLPAEYDPYRRYPTIVALNGAYDSPIQELDAWAGSPTPAANGAAGPRRGEAMRQGYLVIAVDWQKPQQYLYESSSREHLAVLTTLRDAMRRFSIDTDRVYLTGHGIGGEAAWDIGQAHPDLWAGVIPFIAVAGEKFTLHYWENARTLPLYFVAGELDGRSVADNAQLWNKYLRTPGFDVTIAEYKGRGHDPFNDEIKQLFDWMGRKSRTFPPKEFACDTLRPWDNFFWWVESFGLPERNMIHPTDWSSRGARPVQIEGKVQNENRLVAQSKAEHTTIWLSPEIVDFAKPIRVTYNQRKVSGDGRIAPDAAVLLEDVRTRADRQHPFWARIETK